MVLPAKLASAKCFFFCLLFVLVFIYLFIYFLIVCLTGPRAVLT